MPLHFPENFLWGTATSAHQVEGNNRLNDWWQWEAAGRVKNQEVSGLACDHFHRFEEDFRLTRSLGQNAHRFSVEWSRIEPEEGRFSSSALYHYRQVLESLHAHGLKPMATLFHFTLPQWAAKKGGWASNEMPFWFERYVRQCVQHLGDLVPLWITLNEPAVYFYQGYVEGSWPPGSRRGFGELRVVRNLLKGHVRAYETIREEQEKRRWKGRTGLAVYFRLFHPARRYWPLDILTAKLRYYLFNQLFVQAIGTGRIGFPAGWNEAVSGLRDSWDFIGLNYYTREQVRFAATQWRYCFSRAVVRRDAEKNSLEWEVYPQGLYESLMVLKSWNKPIYITENGICTDRDDQRRDFILRHLRELHRAIQDGADVRGYFYWSLMDNFEWANGYGPRFGLIHVDRESQERIPRPSARLFARIAQTNAIDDELKKII